MVRLICRNVLVSGVVVLDSSLSVLSVCSDLIIFVVGFSMSVFVYDGVFLGIMGNV